MTTYLVSLKLRYKLCLYFHPGYLSASRVNCVLFIPARKDKMSCLELLSWLIVVYISYKLIDYLLRLPYVLGRLNRYILITGCDTGFGHEVAKDLDRNGYNVFAGCLTEVGEDILRKQCTCRLKTVHMDVSNPESIRQAYQFVKDNIPEGKGITILVNTFIVNFV